MTHITPTVGRIVYFRGIDGETRAAIIAQVNGDFNLNLHVFPLDAMDSEAYLRESVTHADPEQEPGCFPSWHWMPYQKQQAEKADDARQLTADTDREADDKRWRAGLLDLALRTPGLHHHSDVLRAAAAYQAHIEGETTALAQQPAPGAAHPGYSTLQPHQQRVVDEHAELESRLSKLVAFTRTSFFETLDEAERNRLDQQVACMAMYSDILTDRIAAFAPA